MKEKVVVALIEDLSTGEKIVSVHAHISGALEACWEDYKRCSRGKPCVPEGDFKQELGEEQIYEADSVSTTYSIYYATIRS
jgi:hypothetical protein